MLPVAPIDFIIWYACEFSKAHHTRLTQSLLSYQHLALAIMQNRKKERNHSPTEIKEKSHLTLVRTGFHAIRIVRCAPLASLGWFHL